MTNFLTKAVMGAALAGTALTVAAPAEAQYYSGRSYHRGHDDAGAAIIGGIAGLAIGAAIASSNNNRYYNDQYYNQYPQYNYNSYPRNNYYNQYPRYNSYDQYNYRQCRVERRYDPYYERSVRVRVCY